MNFADQKNTVDWRITIFLIGFLIGLTMVPLAFKWMVLAFFMLMIIIRYFKYSLATSAVVVALLVLPFYNPSRLETITTVSYHHFEEGIKIDYQQAYGIHLSSIFITFALLLNALSYFQRKKRLPFFLYLFIFCSVISIGLILYGSYQYSPFESLSLNWGLQYGLLYALALLLFFSLAIKPDSIVLIRSSLLASLIFQLLLSILQFINQKPLGIAFENSMGFLFYQGIEESSAFYRVDGTFAYSNQLAIVILVYLVGLFDIVNRKSIKWQLPLWFLSGIVIILTQSRTSIVLFALFSFVIVKRNRKQIEYYVNHFIHRRHIRLGLLILSLLLPIMLPRLLYSAHILHEDSGLHLRSQMISEAGLLLLQQPLLGLGPGTNEYLMIHFVDKSVIREFVASVHNGFVSLALEIGVFGTILFFMPFFMISMVRFKKRRPHSSNSKTFLFVYSMGLFFWFIYYLVHPHVGVVEFPYVGILIGYGLYGREKNF